jgi:hypothetical protein
MSAWWDDPVGWRDAMIPPLTFDQALKAARIFGAWSPSPFPPKPSPRLRRRCLRAARPNAGRTARAAISSRCRLTWRDPQRASGGHCGQGCLREAAPRGTAGPRGELQRRDRDGGVTPAAAANPPERNKDFTAGLFGLEGLPIQVPAVSPRADPSPECAGRFAFSIPCWWLR